MQHELRQKAGLYHGNHSGLSTFHYMHAATAWSLKVRQGTFRHEAPMLLQSESNVLSQVHAFQDPPIISNCLGCQTKHLHLVGDLLLATRMDLLLA